MSASSKNHWATLLAVGLPLLVGGCAGGGLSNPESAPAPTQKASTAHLDALILADRLKAEGNVSSAASMYQQAHQANPGDVRPLLGLGDSFLAMGQNANAAEAYGAALAIQPENLDALRGLGHTRILLGQPQFAVTQYQTAVRLAPNDVRALNGLGVAQDQIGDHKAAQETYRKVLAVDPGNQSAKNNMALSLALSGDNDGAIKLLEDISKSSTASTVNRQNLALVYGMSGKLDKAEQIDRADLPDDVVRRNIAAWNATADSEARQQLLKQSLGVELKGRQYSPAAQPTMPLTNLAQASATDEPVYLSTEDNGTLPLITTGKSAQAQSAPAIQTTDVVMKRSTGDSWSDDWDEELVDAADIQRGTTGQAAAVEAPLPPVPEASTSHSTQVAEAAPTESSGSPFLPARNVIADKPAQTDEAQPAPTTAAAASDQPKADAEVKMVVTTPGPAESAAAPTAEPTSAQPAAAPTAEATHSETPAMEPKPAEIAPASDLAVVETKTAEATVTATDLGGAKIYTVQIASYRSESEAATGWNNLTADQKDLLAGLPHSVAKADLGANKGVFYRLQAGAFGDKKDAKALCSGLKSRSIDCMVVEATAAEAGSAKPTRQSMLATDKSFVVGAR